MEIVYYAPQKFFEKYKIFFVPNLKSLHIKSVRPLLSIFGFSPPPKTGSWEICIFYYYTIYPQCRCYTTINFWCVQYANQSHFS
jgi:hypothetical protein